MAKKIFIYYLAFSFLLSTLTIQSMAYMTGFQINRTEEQTRLMKSRFMTLQRLLLLTLRKKGSGADLSGSEFKSLKKIVDYNIDNCMLELNNPLYQQYLAYFSEKFKLNEDYENLTKSDIKAMLSQSENRRDLLNKISSTTLIGVPVGLVINLFSWIVYGIALLFEDSIPILGLFFYTISVIMTGIGWYFIL